ncbi:hypothetical protein K3165_04850 [Qipengyuania sp. 1XM1-15A]|uniref:hypothetical protein n=1 Tax=Qipengyuania xiamenensis TaxID=2867237 RepID=UPI001C8801F7|nr:hypothetical protein [Qipengyuania xiamenensis]MBX7532250.1 hypothetical protein [Qipengyuania xiamenensis]
MKFAKLAVAAVALAATPALANEQVAAGAVVTGPEGNEVGTIVSVENGQAVLDTGKHKVPLGVEMYGQGEAGPTITVTKLQLDDMMDAQLAEAAAKLDAALVEGAAVVTAEGHPFGTIYTVDNEGMAIVQNDDGIVTLARDSFAVTAEGALMVLYNHADLAANMTPVAEGAEILTPAQARAKQAEMAAGDDAGE